MEADRTETRDLAEQDPKRVNEMVDAWNNWARRVETPAASGT
jgi:hypothetical protein